MAKIWVLHDGTEEKYYAFHDKELADHVKYTLDDGETVWSDYDIFEAEVLTEEPQYLWAAEIHTSCDQDEALGSVESDAYTAICDGKPFEPIVRTAVYVEFKALSQAALKTLVTEVFADLSANEEEHPPVEGKHNPKKCRYCSKK